MLIRTEAYHKETILMGICHSVGLHFHDWMDYNGIIFLADVLEWGHIFNMSALLGIERA